MSKMQQSHIATYESVPPETAHIPRPKSAFFLYLQEKRLRFKLMHPEMTMCKVHREMMRSWKDLSDPEKLPYELLSQESKLEYDEYMSQQQVLGYQY